MAKPTLDGKLLFPSDYLAAEEFGGKDVTLTIRDVLLDDLKMTDGSTERKPILLFEKTKKKLVLNKTNATTIAKLYGGEARTWVGKQVTLFPTECNAFGQMVDCIRVRNKAGKKPGGGSADAEAATSGNASSPGSPSLPILEGMLARAGQLSRADYDAATMVYELEISDMVLGFISDSDWRGAVEQMVREIKEGS